PARRAGPNMGAGRAGSATSYGIVAGQRWRTGSAGRSLGIVQAFRGTGDPESADLTRHLAFIGIRDPGGAPMTHIAEEAVPWNPSR
ncbi:hypothetical protein, partial [Streptomyces sp. NPDC002671]